MNKIICLLHRKLLQRLNLTKNEKDFVTEHWNWQESKLSKKLKSQNFAKICKNLQSEKKI